jgi:hypothetical protein
LECCHGPGANDFACATGDERNPSIANCAAVEICISIGSFTPQDYTIGAVPATAYHMHYLSDCASCCTQCEDERLRADWGGLFRADRVRRFNEPRKVAIVRFSFERPVNVNGSGRPAYEKIDMQTLPVPVIARRMAVLLCSVGAIDAAVPLLVPHPQIWCAIIPTLIPFLTPVAIFWPRRANRTPTASQ